MTDRTRVLADQVDCLALAVELKLDIYHHDKNSSIGKPYVEVCDHFNDGASTIEVFEDECERLSATKRVITRAAERYSEREPLGDIPMTDLLPPRVTDADIARAFESKDFGRSDHKHELAMGVLKIALRYHCGPTITQIMMELELIKPSGRVTEKGRRFCYETLNTDASKLIEEARKEERLECIRVCFRMAAEMKNTYAEEILTDCIAMMRDIGEK